MYRIESGGPLPHPDRRGAGDQPVPRGDPRGRAVCRSTTRAYTPCFRREAGSYGKDTRGLIARPPVRQGGDGQVRASRRPSYDELETLVAQRRGGAAAARPALPRARALHRRPQLRRRQVLRPRGLGAGDGQVARGQLVQQLRGFPGAPRRTSASGRSQGRQAASSSTRSTARAWPCRAR